MCNSVDVLQLRLNHISLISPNFFFGQPLREAAESGLAYAVSEIARPRDLDKIVALATHDSLGRKRMFFIRNLMHLRQPIARAVLQALAQDPDVGEEVRSRLGERKA